MRQVISDNMGSNHVILRFVGFCLLAGLLSASVPLQAQRLTLPRVDKASLLNGMQFLAFEGTPAQVPYLLMIENGAAFDPVDKWGVTQLLLRMMRQQTATLSSDQIGRELDRLGAELHAQAAWDAVYFYGTVPEANLNNLLTLLSNIVVRPGLKADILESERARMVQEVEQLATQTPARTRALLREAVFGPNPYGHGLSGNAETLSNIYLEDVILQYRRLFVPNQALLALYHADASALANQMGRRWGSWVRKQPLPFTFRRATPPQQIRISLVESPADQAMLRWGQLGVPRSQPDYLVLKIFEQYLTLVLPDWARQISGSPQVRASASLTGGKMPGLFEFSVQAPPAQILAYAARLDSLLDEIASGQIDVARFEESRELVFQELVGLLADPITRLRIFLEAELRDLGVNYLLTLKLRLDRIRPDLFQQVVQRQLRSQNPVLIVAGPATELKTPLESLGTVAVLN